MTRLLAILIILVAMLSLAVFYPRTHAGKPVVDGPQPKRNIVRAYTWEQLRDRCLEHHSIECGNAVWFKCGNKFCQNLEVR